MRDDETILALMRPSLLRRMLASGLLVALAVVLAWFALAPGSGTLGALAALASAAAALGMAAWLWTATADRLELTAAGLVDSRGRVIAPVERIAGIERGAFALRPSNGFTLRLSEPAGTAWAPGLWWRFGRRVGVGGVTSAAEAKVMAELLSEELRRRADPAAG